MNRHSCAPTWPTWAAHLIEHLTAEANRIIWGAEIEDQYEWERDRSMHKQMKARAERHEMSHDAQGFETDRQRYCRALNAPGA